MSIDVSLALESANEQLFIRNLLKSGVSSTTIASALPRALCAELSGTSVESFSIEKDTAAVIACIESYDGYAIAQESLHNTISKIQTAILGIGLLGSGVTFFFNPIYAALGIAGAGVAVGALQLVVKASEVGKVIPLKNVQEAIDLLVPTSKAYAEIFNIAPVKEFKSAEEVRVAHDKLQKAYNHASEYENRIGALSKSTYPSVKFSDSGWTEESFKKVLSDLKTASDSAHQIISSFPEKLKTVKHAVDELDEHFYGEHPDKDASEDEAHQELKSETYKYYNFLMDAYHDGVVELDYLCGIVQRSTTSVAKHFEVKKDKE